MLPARKTVKDAGRLKTTHQCRTAVMNGNMQLFRSAALPLLLVAACAAPQDAPAPAGGWPEATLDGATPIVIGHRGASGLLPEHTLEAYKLAIEQGADCIEPDLVLTKDGVLVARHDIYLSSTTDVTTRPEFASRKRKAEALGITPREDWWAIDFTLAELKSLRAVQAFPGRSKAFDGQYQVPTFDEVLDLAAKSRTAAGKPVCVYPEAKAPAFHAASGQDMLAPILDRLKAHGLDKAGAPVFIQSFEPDFVRRASEATSLPIVMLAGTKADYEAALAMPGAPFWDGAGVTHPMVANPDGSSTGLIEAAHGKGIAVHVWTYRDDAPVNGGPAGPAMKAALALGADGYFTDFPASGVKARAEFLAARR